MRRLIPILIIFALTVAVRSYRLPQTFIFGEDQEDLSLRVKQIVIDRQPTLLSAKFSQLGFYLPPGYLYALTPFFWLTNFHPATGMGVILLLAGVTGVLLYLAGGWLSWWLYLTSPWLHAYDRIFWNPNLILPAASLVLLGLVKHRLLLVAFGLALALQSHPQAVLLTLMTLLYLRLRRQSFSWKFWLILFISISPLLIFDLRHQFLITRQLLNPPSQFAFRAYYFLFTAPFLIFGLAQWLKRFPVLISMVIFITFVSQLSNLVSTLPRPDSLRHKLATTQQAVNLIASGQASPNIQINGPAAGFHYLIWYAARQQGYTQPIGFHESWDNPPPGTVVIKP